jgi:glycosyltransferase involved in cell wall biosynthesis
MRIVQMIDSLEAGGAEKMAVNYANALTKNIAFSGLVVTRKEGQLLSQINQNVDYIFLNKKNKIDFKAVFKLRKFLKNNKVDILHAHSSSFFTAVLVKLTLIKIKIIWHDHYGINQDLRLRKSLILKYSSLFFKGVISVNTALKDWAVSYLLCSNVKYFPNFIEDFYASNQKIALAGEEGKRIICVANLRPQKNHLFLLDTANLIKDKFPDWSFHLFGKDFKDSYSAEFFDKIQDLQLCETVFFYGSIDDVSNVLTQCDVAVLPSLSEGLPLAVLEYGLHKLPVIATNVGEIKKIITSENNGVIIEANNTYQFTQALTDLIIQKDKRVKMGKNLNEFIQLNFSEVSIIKNYLSWINSSNFAGRKSL